MSLENKKILIMAGGTGGHIFPALSIAQELISRGMKVEWLGTRNSMEEKVIGETGIPMHFISISGLRGKGFLKKLISPVIIFIAIIQSMIKIFYIKPSCVLGMGGFVTGPAGLASWIMQKKLVIHEQNAIAGFTNQVLSPMATTVLEAFPNSFLRKHEISKNKFIPNGDISRIVAIGNPIRKEIIECDRPEIRFSHYEAHEKLEISQLRILVVGGSLGAQALNEVLPEFISLFEEGGRPKVFHQCGSKKLLSTLSKYKLANIEVNNNIQVSEFIDNMAEKYSWADLIICRSGAITVSEIASVGLPSILVPFPYAVDDHQTENAKILAKESAAWVVQQSELSAQKLFEICQNLIADKNNILKMAVAARAVGNDSATEQVAQVCLEACYA